MKYIYIYIYLFFVLLMNLFCGVANAVAISPNITISLTNIDLTIDNLSFDNIIIGTNTVSFNASGQCSTFTMITDTTTNINIIEWNTTDNCQKSWNKTGGATVSYTITGHPTHRYAIIENNGNTVQLIGNALGLVAFSSQEDGIYTVSLGGDSLPEEHLIEEVEQVDEIKNSFVNSWGNIVSMIEIILIVFLAGSALMILRGKTSISSLLDNMPAILLIITLVILGTVIFGSFN